MDVDLGRGHGEWGVSTELGTESEIADWQANGRAVCDGGEI
jgi:hypothetical protein